MVIWDIKICSNCRKVISVRGSDGATEIKAGDILNQLEDTICDDCKGQEG